MKSNFDNSVASGVAYKLRAGGERRIKAKEKW